MRPLLILLMFGILPAVHAQFENLRTNFDGSALYFTTRLVRSGSGQPAHGKALRIDAGGLAVEESRAVEQQPGARTSNFYDISGFDISGDSAVMAIAARRDCLEIGCASLVNVTTTLRRYGAESQYPGPAQLSQNGRYLVNTGSGIARLAGELREWDLATGESWPLVWDWFKSRFAGGRVVADDGTVVHIEGGDVQIQRRGEVRRLTFGSETVSFATIDAAGRFVVFVSRWPAPYRVHSRIRRVDLATGDLVTVIEESADITQPSLSADGDVMTVIFRDQLYLVRTDGTGVRKLTSEAEGIQAGALSGDGRLVFAVTNGGRIARADVETGEGDRTGGKDDQCQYHDGPGGEGIGPGDAGHGARRKWLGCDDRRADGTDRPSLGRRACGADAWEAQIAEKAPVVLTPGPDSKRSSKRRWNTK